MVPHPADTPVRQPVDIRLLVKDRMKAADGHNSAPNMRAREVAKQNKKKAKELAKLVADKCAHPAAGQPVAC